MKAILILVILLGLISFGLIVATSTPNSKDTYKAYERYKERKRKDERSRR